MPEFVRFTKALLGWANLDGVNHVTVGVCASLPTGQAARAIAEGYAEKITAEEFEGWRLKQGAATDHMTKAVRAQRQRKVAKPADKEKTDGSNT